MRFWLKITTQLFLLACFWGLLTSSSVYAQVKISGVNDLAFGTYNGSGDLSSTDDVCIYNAASSNYKITITTATGAYEMRSSGNILPIETYFKESAGSFVQLTYGAATSFTGAHTTSNSCSGTTNGTIRVKILQSALLGVRPGSYTGTLTILLEPG